MDAPPEREDCAPFIRVARWLKSFDLNVPVLVASDLDAGFLLLTDLGTRLYLDELEQNPDRADELYTDALDALVVMQQRGARHATQLPPFDEAFIRGELALFHDWLCATHLGIEWGPARERSWQEVSRLLIEAALAQPTVFVHRDYHSRNLMVTTVDNPGILDFQDAVSGPLSYDLVSLLKDCYISWPSADVNRWAREFFDRLDPDTRQNLGEERFLRSFGLLGIQRHLKAAGIFARLNHRDGKPGYMHDIPRTLAYVVALRDVYPELRFLYGLIEETVLPGLAQRR